LKVNNPLDPNQLIVYAGAFDLEKLNSFPTQKMKVKKVIRVSHFSVTK
jgi:hypothetical protein